MILNDMIRRLAAAMMTVPLLALGVAGTAQASSTLPPPPPGFTTKIFQDSFPGTTLNASKWVTYRGANGIRWNDHGYLPYPYSGDNEPGANTAAMFAPSQVTVNNGLTLTAKPNTNQFSGTYPWISGTVNTKGKFSLPAGGWFVQAKVKMPDTSQGMWPAIWFMPDTPTSPVPELDGFEGGFHELAGVPANRTAHYNYFSAQGQQASEQDIGVNMSAAYHVYGVAFLPGKSITWYFDGKQVFRALDPPVTVTAGTYELMINLEVAAQSTSSWHTVPSATTPPESMHVAEVQIYAAG